MADDPIEELRQRLEAAEAKKEERLKEEGQIPLLPISEWLEEADWPYVWEIVRGIRRDHIGIAIRFPEETLAALVIDIVAGADRVLALEELAGELEAFAEAEGPWLVSTPIANIRLQEPVIEVAPDAVLWHATLGPEWLADRDAASDDSSALDVSKILGDRLPQITEWESGDAAPIDTRRGAALITVEDGVAGLALPRARSRAQYAIAVWTILAPPKDFELLPDVGIWVPQPHIRSTQRFKRTEEGGSTPKQLVRGATAEHWAPYTAPDRDILTAPFEAFAHLDRRCAQALLSATLALFAANRRSRSELSAQLRNTMAALESLCEKENELWAAQERWVKVAARFDVWTELSQRGYDTNDLDELQRRLKWARNIATHSVDAALLDLGYPEQAQRKVAKSEIRPGTDFAFAVLAADLVPLRFALGFVIEKLFDVARSSNWDDSAFEAQFT